MDQRVLCLALWAFSSSFPGGVTSVHVGLITWRCLQSHVDLCSSLSAVGLNRAIVNPTDPLSVWTFPRLLPNFLGLCWKASWLLNVTPELIYYADVTFTIDVLWHKKQDMTPDKLLLCFMCSSSILLQFIPQLSLSNITAVIPICMFLQD